MSDMPALDHLGRIVDAGGASVGTCFQVGSGVLVTAWHVLCDLDAETLGATVGVGRLTGGLTVPATVVRVDPINDLAVLRCELPLAASVDGLRETGSVGTGTDVVVSGVAEVDDPDHEVRYLERVSGQWGGQLARDGTVLGHLKSRDVVPGMSGAPVTLPGGTQVVGVVSARYNSTTGWLRDSVWIARTEDLVPLLAGVLDRARPLAERLPPGVTELLYRMRETLNELPYAPAGYGRIPLLEVYVSQSVAEPAAQRRPRLEEFDDLEQLQLEREQSQVEKERLALLVQPFDEVFGQHQHLVVQGDGGMGKTTLVNRLVLRLVDAVLDDGADGGADGRGMGDATLELTIPVLLPARTLAAQPESTWPAMLRTAVQSEYGPFDSDLPEAIFAAPVAGCRWRIVVDALDEIPDPASRQRLLVTLAAKMVGTGGPSHFLVTSRPLHPGEIARVQKPGVGCYDLQRFDEDALAAFAKAWLGDTAAAGRFLTAVRLARLEDILQVPLLATVAVQVYLASPDRQLPPSHYQLYQRYITLSVARREEYAQQVLAQLPATADGNRLRDWLAGHRWELLEHLAKAYTTSERQLLPAAEQYLRGGVPHLDELPANWETVLVHWLAQTGIVNPGRRQLRFTHLIFAEHLAATADARALPPFFDADRPEFAELLTSGRLGVEGAIRTLLYYLHLHEHDPSTLDRLQQGAREDRRLAGQLVAKGAPCTDDQLKAHVEQIEDDALASGLLDPDAVSALISSPWVRSRLMGLLTGPTVALDSRIGLIDLLHEHSAEAKRFGTTLLRQEVPSAFPFSVRRRGAMVLSRLGAEQRDLAAKVLHELTSNAAADDDDRLQAAEDLARLGTRHRDLAVAALHALAGDAMVAAHKRRGAAYALVKFGGAARDSAAAALHALAADPNSDADERRQAAEDLARLGGAHRQQGTRDLIAVAADPAVGAGDRAMTLAALAAFDPTGQDRAAEELHEFAADRRPTPSSGAMRPRPSPDWAPDTATRPPPTCSPSPPTRSSTSRPGSRRSRA
ncbi:trypsin-like peptidase domain-containing protein [Dactylosporangium sp. NPDC049525]|uniref:trypsin-like peptidase domain-containing protein n=1 Tax=Dactylosporangium sp. NPDC049525 TaxID=3154730 RepID=UPI003412758F